MRVAVASENGEVAQHFGRCPEYVLYDVENGKVVGKSVVTNPGHEPGFLPRFLAERAVNCVIAGGMGPRAEQLFRQQGIEVITGVTGSVDRVISDYIAGRLRPGGSFCDHPRSI